MEVFRLRQKHLGSRAWHKAGAEGGGVDDGGDERPTGEGKERHRCLCDEAGEEGRPGREGQKQVCSKMLARGGRRWTGATREHGAGPGAHTGLTVTKLTAMGSAGKAEIQKEKPKEKLQAVSAAPNSPAPPGSTRGRPEPCQPGAPPLNPTKSGERDVSALGSEAGGRGGGRGGGGGCDLPNPGGSGSKAWLPRRRAAGRPLLLRSTSPETWFGAGAIHGLEGDKLLTTVICKHIIQPAPFLGYTADNFVMQKEKKDQNQPTCQGT